MLIIGTFSNIFSIKKFIPEFKWQNYRRTSNKQILNACEGPNALQVIYF